MEVDEVLLRHVRVKGSGQLEQRCVVGLACEGRVVTGMVPDRKRATLHAIIRKHVHPESIIVTDDWIGYKGIEKHGYFHVTVNHSIGFFNENGFLPVRLILTGPF